MEFHWLISLAPMKITALRKKKRNEQFSQVFRSTSSNEKKKTGKL